MTEEFKNVCNNKSETFIALADAIALPRNVKKEQVLRFLSFINSVIDFYLEKPTDDEVRYPIIYIPASENWAKEVCIKFIILKMSLSRDKKTYAFNNKFKDEITYFSESETRRHRRLNDMTYMHLETYGKYLYKTAQAFKNLLKETLPKINPTPENDTNNIIVCGKKDFDNSNRNDPFIKRFYTTKISEINEGEKNLCVLYNEPIANLKRKLEEEIKIENIFLFHNNMNHKRFNTYQKSSTELNGWNQEHGLKNCFIFRFSTQPYQLNRIISRAKGFCSNFVRKEISLKHNDYPDFISLSSEESDFIFNRESTFKRKVVSLPESEFTLEDKKAVADFFSSTNYNVNDRDLFALCLNDSIKREYCNYIEQNNELEDIPEVIFKIQSQISKYVINEVKDFLGKDQQVGLVIVETSSDSIKTAVQNFFSECGIDTVLYNYRDLKYKSETKSNNIKEKKVVVFRYRKHYLNSAFVPKYPNSFDPLYVNEGQEVLEIINGLAFLDYESDKYNYEKYQNVILSSDYRKNVLKDMGKELTPPLINTTSYNNGDDDDNINLTGDYTIPTAQIVFTDGSKSSLQVNDLVVYNIKENEKNINIDSLKNIIDTNTLDDLFAIQKAEELSQALEYFIKEHRNISLREEIERESLYKQELITESEAKSNIPVWKFFLKRKVEKYGVEQIYSDSKVSVSLNTFKDSWCDAKDTQPILPRQRKDQRNLFNYLKLDNKTLGIYRFKLASTKSNTRRKNTSINEFLQTVLFNYLDDEIYNQILSNERICDLLQIESEDDIIALKEIAEESIKLKQIKKITITQ